MKSLFLFFFTMVISTSAHALTVGDSAVFTVMAPGNTQVVEVKVTQISGDQYFTEAFSRTYNLPHRTIKGTLTELAHLNDLYQACDPANLETISTPAGTFKTCHVIEGDEEAYLSPEVTFGVVKSKSRSFGEVTESVLTSFSHQ